MKSQPIHIVGAGPAGLTAAINLARGGIKTIVHEKNSDVDKNCMHEDCECVWCRHGKMS